MRYGLPYKGSKNSIAEWVIENLPGAEVFADLFFGGGAVTHCAMLSGKYKRFIANDIDARLPKLFLECAHGKHTIKNHAEWVGREEFYKLKDRDAYIALVWSFGNNGKDYIYGKDKEQFKRDYHRAVFADDTSILEKYGYNIKSSHRRSVYERYLEFNKQIKDTERKRLSVIAPQIEIERLQALRGLQALKKLTLSGVSYEKVSIPDGALIYCDIPYIGTNCGKYGGFDHERFYDWALQQDNIFISEYSMPGEFVEIANTEKTVLSSSASNSDKATERLYTNKRTFEKLSEYRKNVIRTNIAQQTTIFDFI